MAVLTMGSLVWKRYHERPHRRPWRIWMYDVSKQVIGASFVHITNLFLSIISKIRLHVFTVKGNPKRICDNPCDYYFLNLLFDTTIGIPILYFFIVGITGVLKGMHIHAWLEFRRVWRPAPTLKLRQAVGGVFGEFGPYKAVGVCAHAVLPHPCTSRHLDVIKTRPISECPGGVCPACFPAYYERLPVLCRRQLDPEPRVSLIQ